MKKFIIQSTLLLLLAGYVNGQSYFVQTIGSVNDEKGMDLVQTADSGFVVTGSVSTGNNEDMYLAKFDKNGMLVWEKRYGGASNEQGLAIAQLPWGGYVISGLTTGFGSGDVFIMKTDENGDTLWTRDYGASGTDIGRVIEVTPGGNYRVGGLFFIGGTNKPGVLTVDSNGVQLAANFISNQFASPDYRAHYLHGNKMGVTGGGQMLMFTDTLGVYSGQLSFGSTAKSLDACYIPGGYYAIAHWTDIATSSTNCGLLLTDTLGVKIWNVKLSTSDDDLPVWVKPDGHGGILVAIHCRNVVNFNSKLVLVAFDMQGNIKWQKRYSPGGTNNHSFGNVIPTLNGGYALTGAYHANATSNYNLVLITADSTGTTACDVFTHNLQLSSAVENTANPASALTWSLANTGLPIQLPTVPMVATASLHCSTTTSVAEMNMLTARIWPNPVKDVLNVVSEVQHAMYTITDATGRIHITGQLNSQHERISVSSLQPGIYFLEVREGKAGNVLKFIVE